MDFLSCSGKGDDAGGASDGGISGVTGQLVSWCGAVKGAQNLVSATKRRELVELLASQNGFPRKFGDEFFNFREGSWGRE